MVEIYTKNFDTDDDYDPNLLDEFDPLSIYLNQLRQVLNNSYNIMGASDMISTLEQYVYEYNLNEQEIERKLNEIIFKYCSFRVDFPTKVKVKFLKGTVRDIAVVDITVNQQVNLKIFIK
jgi:hypothetical protein